MTVSVETLITRSEARIGNVHPCLKEYAVELIKRCYKEGIRVQLSSGYRSPVDQAYIYGQGRSSYIYNGKQYGRMKDGNGKQFPIISNAKPGTSIHNYGLAIDYFLVTEDGNNSIWTVNSDWKRVAAIAKSMGFEWGGDWSSFRDYPHLQYTKGLTLGKIASGMRPAFPKLNITAEAKSFNKLEEKREETKLFNTGSLTLNSEFKEMLVKAREQGIIESEQWEKKATDGTMTESEAIGLTAIIVMRAFLDKE